MAGRLASSVDYIINSQGHLADCTGAKGCHNPYVTTAVSHAAVQSRLQNVLQESKHPAQTLACVALGVTA